jgi:pyruvate/2-oxoglutarate dehydrogenase complex dihydrolipoamide acyltransferase (E2) component
MAKPLHVPRVNNNDDTVLVVAIHVAAGSSVNRGDVLAEVETSKAVQEVEAEHSGYVLDVLCAVGDEIAVGAVMMWIGDTPEEPIPELPAAPEATLSPTRPAQPTAKARALLKKFGLDAEQVRASGERLSAADVEAYVSRKGLDGGPPQAATRPVDRVPGVPGELVDLSMEERGMLDTVSWHRDRAASAYLEIEYDPTAWEGAAAAYARERKLMLSPLLPLMAYRLVELARARPKLNSTIVGDRRYQYGAINLGFTVQAGATLYLTVIHDAGAMSADRFVEALGEVQRHAMAHKLKPKESQGATLAFSSMSRWKVTRHMPILPPSTSLIVAHAATGGNGRAVMGASYDHRVLSGFDAARLLQDLAKPPALA